jgi:hypothetical protein
MRRAAAYGLIAGLLPALAHAASCPQDRAVYRDRDNAYELVFDRAQSAAEAAEHRFSLKVLGSDVILDGYVMGSSPVERPNGMIFFNCPEGDVTGKDIAACTVWQGVIYAETAGRLDLLPGQGNDAADKLLLPDFGPSIRQSKLWKDGKAKIVPWDVLDFRECAS